MIVMVADNMETIILLAMHGSPPKDFPPELKREFFALHGKVEGAHGPVEEQVLARYNEIEDRMRCWPRTEENDPYHFASTQMAGALEDQIKLPVLICFNEFCGPSIPAALEEAVSGGFKKVIVTTPMMTRGGGHAGKEIPAIVDEAVRLHPDVEFIYAWPFRDEAIGRFLADQIRNYL